MTILSSISNSGNAVVVYALSANPTTLTRSGNIRIADQIFTVTQLGGSSTNADISLGEALDTEGELSWSTIGTPAWFGQSLVSHDGVDAAQSGPITNSSAVTAMSILTGPGTLSFWWKVSSETNKDYLKFFVDGVQQTRISGEVDWQLLSYTFPSGSYTSKWTYSKNNQLAAGNDRGWLDQVTFLPGVSCVGTLSHSSATHSSASETGEVNVTVPEGCALNAFTLSPWITNIVDTPGGFVRYTLAINSLPVSRTGTNIIAGQPFLIVQQGSPLPCIYSILPAGPTFYGFASATAVVSVTAQDGCEWNVVNTNAWITITSSLSNSGNGAVNYSIAQNTSFVTRTGEVRIGDQILTISQSAAPAPITSLAEALDTLGTSLVWTSGGYTGDPWSWIGQGNVSHDGVDSAQSGAIPDQGYSILQTTVNGPGTLSFWWKVSSETNYDTLRLLLNYVEQARISGEVDWQQRSLTVPAGTQTIEWYYSKDISLSMGQDRAWVDQVQFVPIPGCPATLSATNAFYPSSSSTGSVSVAIAPGCSWGVSNPNSWISILSGSGETGGGNLPYIVEANPTAYDRSGTIQIADQILAVTQSGTFTPPSNCDYTVGPNGIGPGSYTGFIDTFSIDAQSSCQWTVLNTNSWITITSNLSGSGIGQVTFSVSQNPSSDGRSGNISVGGQLVTISQSGAPSPPPRCTYSISTPSYTQGYGAATNSVTITAGAGCAWSVSNTNSWINFLSGTSGAGNGTVMYSIPENPSTNARSGNVQIAGLNYTLTQGGAPVGGCAFVLTPVGRTHGSASSTGMVSITTSNGCAWQVLNTNSWVTMVGPTNGTGGGQVLYSVETKLNANSRVGTLSIGGHLFFIIQTGAVASCTISISPGSRTHGYSSATNTVAVTTSNGCPWSVVNTNPWISILSGLANSSSGTMVYSVAQNTNAPARTGIVRLGGQSFLLTQSGASLSGTNAPWLQIMSQTETGATLAVQGTGGKMYVVECSEDSIHWIPISTNSAPSIVTDTPLGNAPQRFYRTVEIP